MGTRITDETTYALYDSVTGHAFGPTFTSEEEAESFLAACDDEDPRNMLPDRLAEVYDEWHERTHDEDGDFIPADDDEESAQ